ncbi:MAG: HU family DNA-binding protein [Deltaproteobacteria bacterium]|nr:HU family DNA-binding protein [Deltaproteobacteria bacterium]
MPLTKADIIESLSLHYGFSKTNSNKVVESILQIIKETLPSGEDVLKTERRGRNPQTGDDLTLGARRVVKFKCSVVLRDKINWKE